MKLLLIVTLLAIGLPQSLESQTRPAETKRASTPRELAPGTYQGWQDVDEVTIVQPFNASTYSKMQSRPSIAPA